MNKSYIYTETAFHHEGNISFMKELIDSSERSGADGIKFQVMTETSNFISTRHSAFVNLNRYCFSLSMWEEIFEYTALKGLEIIMMPLNMGAFELLKKYIVHYLDIHSVSFNDFDLIEKIKESEIDVILGVGGRTLDEIISKYNYFGKSLKVLMVGFQSFPSQLEDVKIGKISFLKKMFPTCSIGYADHSSFDNEYAVKSNEYARLLGATFFEKHITVSEGTERVDYASAISENKLKKIIENIRFVEKNILTDFAESFEQNEKEITYRNRQLVCVAAKNLAKGVIIKRTDLALKLIDNCTGIFNNYESLIGLKLNKDLNSDDPITKDDLIIGKNESNY